MLFKRLALALVSVAVASACSNETSATDDSDSGAPGDDRTAGDSGLATGDSSSSGDARTVTNITVVMGGDIAEAGRTQYARNNAAHMSGHLPTVSAVVLLGDNARYGGAGGLLQYYDTYYQPAGQANWGQFDLIAFPGLGNHEYNEANAQGYFDYFASRMASIKAMETYHGYIDVVGKGYYSFDLNGWHLVSVNSNCGAVTGGCAAGSDQEVWLKGDLVAHATMPIIAAWHSPRYACGGSHSDDIGMQAMWADLFDVGADFLFVGHNHYYQRWLPLDKTSPEAVVDTQHGLTQVVAGSYGVSTYTVCTSVDSRIGKQKGGDAGMGAFFLTLGSDGTYSWEYLLESDGSQFDSGSGYSHHAS